MASDQLIPGGGPRYGQMQQEPSPSGNSSTLSFSSQSGLESPRIFEELPEATIVSVSRPDTGDISPMLLTYTIEFRYKQFKWQLVKKASQVFYLHFALKRRTFVEEIHEKQEQVREWLQNLGIGDHTAVVHDEDDPDDETVPLHHDESSRNRDVPSSAALPIIRPALGRQNSMSDRAKGAMQGYLNHFLSNLDIVNSQEVCRFLEVSRLLFSLEYGPKLKEDFVVVKHLPEIPRDDDHKKCWACNCFGCCKDNWQKVWAVLKPGFLALLKGPFDSEPLDIVVFDVLPASDGNGEGRVSLAKEIKERNPLCHSFKVSCGNQNLVLRSKSRNKVKDWVAAINDAGLRPSESWCHPHRFGSFAPPRGLTEDGSQAQWFVDGQAAFEAIALAIEKAKFEIFISGWWLCPELYPQRPFHEHASSRLDALVEAKAKQGVQIYILLYKEVALALKINSVYGKKKLLGIHKNVRVLRYPDHFSSGVYLWSHHEKLVIVDYHVCFVGGLDLCFGRYDSFEHKVGDYPPVLESEPNSWEHTMKDELDRQKYPRMPWHDVHCALSGPPYRDVARHFVQRWNYAKRNKAPNELAIPLLMPHHHMVIPHYMGKNREMNVQTPEENNQRAIKRQDSLSSQMSYQDVPLLMPEEAEGLDTSNGGSKTILFRKPKIEPLMSETQMKSFVDELDTSDCHQNLSTDVLVLPGIRSSDKERGDQVVSVDEVGEVGPHVSCCCQVIRSVSPWSAGTSQTEDSIHNAYCSLIEKAEHFVYIENQFFISGLSGDEIIQNRVLEALYRRIMRACNEKKGGGGVDNSGAAAVRTIMHWQYRTICGGNNSILHNLADPIAPKMHDYISFYGLRSYGRLYDGGPVACSQVHVHSKIMIIDDSISLIGSANINDRSLLGSRDSEIGVVIEDKEFVDSVMAGKPWKAGKFALSLRLSLWSEHLGLHAGEINQISDPVADSTYKDIWMSTAKTNVMHLYCTNRLHQQGKSCTCEYNILVSGSRDLLTKLSFSFLFLLVNILLACRVVLRQSTAFWKEKLGQTTVDLGIAPEKLESYQDGNLKVTNPVERLNSVKGHLVSFPLDFMCKEDLRPGFKESEYYASHVFH
ncbi:Phospholipase D [Bertholletia excelsa]